MLNIIQKKLPGEVSTPYESEKILTSLALLPFLLEMYQNLQNNWVSLKNASVKKFLINEI